MCWPGEEKDITEVSLCQSGKLRPGPTSSRWLSLTATHQVWPLATRFFWEARIRLVRGIHLSVVDSYSGGVGPERVQLLSFLPLASTTDIPELNKGTRHRYLTEAVWYPTTLLPRAGVRWRCISKHAALATLRNHDLSVSLEFRFNSNGEVKGIYSPGRYGRFGNRYIQVPWEGHFSHYQTVHGLRIPMQGEADWYHEGKLELVWQATIVRTEPGPQILRR
ncbi:DUF6544 family protein [Desulfolithobacter sp.]